MYFTDDVSDNVSDEMFMQRKDVNQFLSSLLSVDHILIITKGVFDPRFISLSGLQQRGCEAQKLVVFLSGQSTVKRVLRLSWIPIPKTFLIGSMQK